MKNVQFKRVNNTLRTLLGCSIISEGRLVADNHIIKLGFYPHPHMSKQLVLFDRDTGKYQLGVEKAHRTIEIYGDLEGYTIGDLRKMINEVYYPTLAK